MSKRTKIERTNVGIDISKEHIDVCIEGKGPEQIKDIFTNDVDGWRNLAKLFTKKGIVRVVMESTGTYHFDCALFLHAQKNVEIMIVNPRAARNFARARMERAKTDRVDAEVLCEFAARMDFVPWQPPRKAVLEMRAIVRRICALKDQAAAEKNRMEAMQATGMTPQIICNNILASIAQMEEHITQLTAHGVALVEADAEMGGKFARLMTITGVAQTSALLLLAELLVLPGDMTVEQWVAHCGLDPRPFQSGSSIHRPARISKTGNARLRAALYFPAITAKRHDPHVRAFAEKLATRNLRPLQIVVAVMRKLLHAIYGMLKTHTDWNGEKFYTVPA